MTHCASPRARARTAVAVAAVVPLLVGPAVPSAGTPGDRRTVRLDPESGSVVRSAEVRLPPGLTRLRTSTYSLVGATWHGPAPTILVRTEPGEPWERLPLLGDHRPSRGSGEGTPTLGATDLLWAGDDTGIDVRVQGSAHRDLELVLIDPGQLPSDDTATAEPEPEPLARTSAALTTAPKPDLLNRKAWGADPDWRNGSPVYLDVLKQIHVHHTATGNSYDRADVPGIIRGMYRYHTQSLGWFDIGYNFLVDRFGRAWVGRSGGADRLVRGAHTLGFNHASVGVAVIGNLEQRNPWREAVSKLVRVAAWKLDKHGRYAVGKVSTRSTGSDRYPEGTRVRLPAIDGHRDTNYTACPGQELYDRLPGIRRRTQDRIDAFG